MANIKSFPNNQDVYIGAEDVMKWLHGRTSGVFGAEGNASVSAVQGEMAVTVSDGLGWMASAGKDGIVWWNDHEAVNGTKMKVAFDPADSTLNRVDRIIVEWKTTNYVDLPEVKILKGSLSSAAVAPELTNNSTVRQISLAQVSIAAGTTAITASMITDERLDPSVCGIVTESVTIDTSTMQNQFEALLTAIRQELQNLNAGTECLLKSGGVPAPTKDDQAANKKYVDDSISNFESGMSMELLWENASPTSAFATQDINVPVSEYDRILIEADIGCGMGASGKAVVLGYPSYAGNVCRIVDVYDSHVHFHSGKAYMFSSGEDTNDTFAIPQRIYGVKGVSA